MRNVCIISLYTFTFTENTYTVKKSEFVYLISDLDVSEIDNK